MRLAPWQVRGNRRYCSRECSNPARGTKGPKNHRWRGGRRIRRDGYVLLNLGGREVLEHRHVMSQIVGRPLRSDEHVHHKNHNKADNRPENLELLTHSEHSALHASRTRGKRDPKCWVTVSCLRCGRSFERMRRWVENHPRTYCQRSCFVGSSRPRAFA